MRRRVIDVSGLPTYGFGQRGLAAWGTWGFILTEGAIFGMLIVAYLYLRTRTTEWPPLVGPPDLFWGTLNTVILLASTIPNHLVEKAAKKKDLSGVRLWMVVAMVFAAGFLLVRVFEFRGLYVYWDTNAYGSIVWVLLGFHTFHLLTDAMDSAGLTVLMFTGPLEGKHFMDVADNAMYWYFVVLIWLPVYAVLYIAPRLL